MMALSLPESLKKPLRKLRYVGRIPFYGGTGRLCPVCGNTSRRFRSFGMLVRREDAQCIHCGALERHRLVWLFLQRSTDLFDGKPKQVLHVAPEPCFERKLKTLLGKSYLTADLVDPSVMVQMDITDIDYPDESFDVIYCSHVLEHVAKDRQAMSEFYRTLKKGGWAVLLVPISGDKTFEDWSIVDPKERLRAFGHEGHVRSYGADYVERLRSAGFHVDVIRVSDLVERADATLMGLSSGADEIFYCTK